MSLQSFPSFSASVVVVVVAVAVVVVGAVVVVVDSTLQSPQVFLH